jgi:hypothetical protein
MSLFRQEAIRQQQQRYYGAIVLRSPQVFVWLSVAVLCIAVLLMSLLIWGQYVRADADLTDPPSAAAIPSPPTGSRSSRWVIGSRQTGSISRRRQQA